MSFDDIAALLPLSEEILNAVAHRSGPIGDVIRCAESHEQLESPAGCQCGSLTGEEVRSCYLEAMADLREIFA